MKQPLLWKRVIFVDWHGVLSRDPFWISILQSSTHPVRPQLEARLKDLFSGGTVVNDWMKGLLSSEDVISSMGIELPRRFGQDFLAKRLDFDCTKMQVNVELFELLRALRSSAFVVLATDNMDCFARAFDQARARRRRRTPSAAETLADWASICDDIVCSSKVGALKAEDPVGFFGPWLGEHGLNFEDALLIDDREDNCLAFRERGGQPVQWKMGTDDIGEAERAVAAWLGEERSYAAV